MRILITALILSTVLAACMRSNESDLWKIPQYMEQMD